MRDNRRWITCWVWYGLFELIKINIKCQDRASTFQELNQLDKKAKNKMNTVFAPKQSLISNLAFGVNEASSIDYKCTKTIQVFQNGYNLVTWQQCYNMGDNKLQGMRVSLNFALSEVNYNLLECATFRDIRHVVHYPLRM